MSCIHCKDINCNGEHGGMTPTPRPWKERREEIEARSHEAALLITALNRREREWILHVPVQNSDADIVFADCLNAIDDCLREIDRREELIGRLKVALRNRSWLGFNESDEALLREADEVTHV